jgi:hypothetical protein
MTTDTTKAIARAILGELRRSWCMEAEEQDWPIWQDVLRCALAAEKALAPAVGEDEGLLAEADRLASAETVMAFPLSAAVLIRRLASRLRSRPDAGRTKDEDKSSEKGSV